jgi:hypothetical protein
MDLSAAIAVTAHLGLAGDYNAVHPHVRLSHGHVIAGAYLNSEERLSLYAGLRGERGPWFIEGGIVTGYTGVDVAPYARMGYDFERMTIFVAPAYEREPEPRVGAVVGLEWRF